METPVTDAVRGESGDAALRLERFIPYRVTVIADWLSESLASTYKHRFGITIPEWRILAVLSRFQPLSATEVGELSNMDKPRVSRALSRMTRADLVQRRQDPNDQRVAVLRLTDEGTTLYREIAPLALDWERSLLEGMDENERQLLDQLLEKLQQRASEMRNAAR